MIFSAPAAPILVASATERGRRRRLVRKRCWLLLAAAGLFCLPFYPPAWHAALRTWLVWQAHRHGCDLTVASMDGGLFDTTQLYGLRCRRHGPPPADGSEGTDVSITRAELTLAWTVPWFQRPAPSWVRAVVLDGVRGRWDLRASGHAPRPPISAGRGPENRSLGTAMIPGDVFARALGALFPSLRQVSARLMPETFLLRADDLRLERGRYLLHATGLWLSGSRDDDGQFMAHALTLAGPGFENTLAGPHGQTYWQDSRLTISSLALGPDVHLVSATLDGSHLRRQRLDWECKLTALGGEVRGQGAVDFSHERIALEVAASLRGVAVRPLAHLLGIAGPADGLIDQGNLTFRGDPENWPAAQMWLAAHSTDFRWGKRRWENLELQAVVVNQRVQVHRLELRQSANRLSLTGECPLPFAPDDAHNAAEVLRHWRESGFSCEVDARLEDLSALADLFGPGAPELAGRMSINGALSARPGAQQDIDGYLNVEGTRLVLRGAPLDYLRSTLVFKDGGVRMADLQATHDGDYFTGTGSMRLDGPPRYEGELRAQVGHLAVYTAALAGIPLADDLARITGLSALLRWDDSVLAFDECKGRLGGAPFSVGGTVDLRETPGPALNLTYAGENVPLTDDRGQEWARADCALAVRSAAGQPPAISGDVRLLDGRLGAELDLVPAGDAASGPFLSVARWLPDGWRGGLLDLNIAAAAPLVLENTNFALVGWPPGIGASPPAVTPDLHLCPASSLQPGAGKLEWHDAVVRTATGELMAARGAVYFLEGIDGPARVSLVATGAGKAEVALFGYSDRLEEISVGAAAPEQVPVADQAALWPALRPASLPLPWLGDETPWADWLTAQGPEPQAAPPALQLR